MLLLCPACLVGLALGPSLSSSPLPWLIGAVLCALGALISGRSARLLLLLLACSLLGLARGSRGEDPQRIGFATPMLWKLCLRETPLEGAGTPVSARVLAAYPEGPHGGQGTALWRGDRRVELWQPVGLSGSKRMLRGECWLLRGRLRPPHAGRRGPEQLSAMGPGLRLSPGESPADRLEQGFALALSALRREVRRGLDRAAPMQQHGLFVALVLGDRSGLDDNTRESFVRTGTAHLLAISGLHVGMLLVTLLTVLRRLLGFLLIRLARNLAAGGWASHLALLLAVAGATAYVLVAGSPVSAKRALFMIVAAAGASLLGRPHIGINALALAALAICWADPDAVFDVALHLSVVAVGGLLALSHWMRARGASRVTWLRASLGLVAASAVAAVATAPICLWAFGRVAVAGLWVNSVAVPLLGSLTLPPLLAGSLLAALSPPLGEPLLYIAALPAAAGLALIRWAGVPQRSPLWVAELGGAEVLACYLFCLVVAVPLLTGRSGR